MMIYVGIFLFEKKNILIYIITTTKNISHVIAEAKFIFRFLLRKFHQLSSLNMFKWLRL